MTDDKDLKKEPNNSNSESVEQQASAVTSASEESKKENQGNIDSGKNDNTETKSPEVSAEDAKKSNPAPVVEQKPEVAEKIKTTDMKDKKQFATHKDTDELIKEIHEVAQEMHDVSSATTIAELNSVDVTPKDDNLIPVEPVAEASTNPTVSQLKVQPEANANNSKPIDTTENSAVEKDDLKSKDDSSDSSQEKPKEEKVEDSSKSTESSETTQQSELKTEVNSKPSQSDQKDSVSKETPEDTVVKNMVAEAGGAQKKEEKEEKKSFLFKLFAKFRKQPKKDAQDEDKKDSKKSKTKKILMIIGIFLLTLLLLGGGIAALAYFQIKPVINHGLKTIDLSKQVYQSLKSQNLVEASAKIAESKKEFQALQASYQKVGWLKFIPGLNKYQADGEAALNAGFAGIEAAEIGIDAITPYADVLGFNGEGTFVGGTVEDRIVNTVATLDKVTPKLDDISQKWSIVKSEMSKIDPNDYPEEYKGKKIRENIIKVQSLINDGDLALTDAEPIVKILPQLLGYPDPKTYMVIFQNDGEIRPTGGFMSAFAIMKLDKGRIIPEKSDDIYSLDRKFNSRNVQPPEAIAKYLNEKTWYLRNMNFSPDFYQSMSTFKKYYDTLDDEPKIDGIITIDTQVLKGLIEVLGSIDVPGYGTFTAENDSRCDLPQIVCELEYIVDKPLPTMVSNRKSSILGPMMKVLINRSLGGGKEQLTKLVPLTFNLLSQKHILVYFTDDTAQKAAEMFKIAGRVKDFDGDYLYVNNANLGGAKSNFYITNEFKQDIEIKDDGTVVKKLELKFNHNRASDNCNLESGELCLSGIQQDYFRVYVPKGSKLTEALGTEDEIVSHEDNDLNKTYFEGFFKLNPESRSIIRLTYELPFKVQKGSVYKMLIQKQPGTKSDKYTININGQKDEFSLDKDVQKQWTL